MRVLLTKFFLEKRFHAFISPKQSNTGSAKLIQRILFAARPLRLRRGQLSAGIRLSITFKLSPAKDEAPLTATSLLQWSPAVHCWRMEIDLPGHGAEDGALPSRKLEWREPAWLGPSRGNGRSSLTWRPAKIWSSIFKYPSTNRLSPLIFQRVWQFSYHQLLPSHTLLWKHKFP